MAGEVLKQARPTFECSCGFVDYVGQFRECPVCLPDPTDADPDCFFLRVDNNACRIDGTACPYAKSRNYDVCPKLVR